MEVRLVTRDDLTGICELLGYCMSTGDSDLFIKPDIMSWKYFPDGQNISSNAIVCTENGRFRSFMGWFATSFMFPGGGRRLSTHGCDWGAAKGVMDAGLFVSRYYDGLDHIQFSIGGTIRANRLKRMGGYRLLQNITTYRHILNRVWRLRDPATSNGFKRMVKTVMESMASAPRHQCRHMFVYDVKPLDLFDPDILKSMSLSDWGFIHTERSPERLNHLLTFPTRTVRAAWFVWEGKVCGYGMVNTVMRGALKVGIIVDMVVMPASEWHWIRGYMTLIHELRKEGVDIIEAYGSAPVFANMLTFCGFHAVKTSELLVRDIQGAIPADIPWYLTHMEADHFFH